MQRIPSFKSRIKLQERGDASFSEFSAHLRSSHTTLFLREGRGRWLKKKVLFLFLSSLLTLIDAAPPFSLSSPRWSGDFQTCIHPPPFFRRPESSSYRISADFFFFALDKKRNSRRVPLPSFRVQHPVAKGARWGHPFASLVIEHPIHPCEGARKEKNCT